MNRARWERSAAGLALALALPLAQAAAGAAAIDPQVALNRYKCYLCHADRENKAGPAYAEVARRYRSDPNAVARLAREIRRGIRSGGPWHMPPHPEVPASEARAMARYIMALAPAGKASGAGR
jgi:cytochrome c